MMTMATSATTRAYSTIEAPASFLTYKLSLGMAGSSIDMVVINGAR
jgi:hypothetical protein